MKKKPTKKQQQHQKTHNMKTIVMEIFAAIENNVHLNPDGPLWNELKHETLEKEKQQIYDAFEAGGGMFDDPEQYYKAIYTQNK
jgi:hypothetical protein